MQTQSLQKFAVLVPLFFTAWFILAIVLFIKRKKIIAKYQVGYISSFLFAAYMLTPFTMGIPALFSPGAENRVPALIMSFVYPAIGFIIFMIVYRDKPLEYRLGKFFAMLGIGLCAALIAVFKMLKIFNTMSSDNYSPSSHSPSSTPPLRTTRTLYDDFGRNIGHINEQGQIIDEFGKYKGVIDEHGNICDEFGKLQGRINENNQLSDAFGKYKGYINEQGQFISASGKYLGRSE